MAQPVERKVQASTAAAAVSGMALWVLGKYVFKGDVPDVFASWIYVLVPGLLAFLAGYRAPHTSRPVPPPVTVAMNTTSGWATGGPVTTTGTVGEPPTGVTP